MSMNLQNFSVRALFQLKRPTAFLVLLLLPLPFASSLHVVCKSPKKSHFITLRAKRATFVYKITIFEFSHQNSKYEFKVAISTIFGAKIQMFYNDVK